MMAVTSKSPLTPSEEKQTNKNTEQKHGLKMQLCFAKIIDELGWHGNSQVSCTNLELLSICIVGIFILNPYLPEDFWHLADLLIKMLHFCHVYT